MRNLHMQDSFIRWLDREEATEFAYCFTSVLSLLGALVIFSWPVGPKACTYCLQIWAATYHILRIYILKVVLFYELDRFSKSTSNQVYVEGCGVHWYNVEGPTSWRTVWSAFDWLSACIVRIDVTFSVAFICHNVQKY